MKTFEILNTNQSNLKDLVSGYDRLSTDILLHQKISKYTRIHKVIADLSKNIEICKESNFAIPGLYISGKQLIEQEILELSPILDNVPHVIFSYKDDIENLDHILLEKSHLYIDSKIDPVDYEKLFSSFGQTPLLGVCFDVDNITKGCVSLAHRFNLEISVSEVLHERHLEKIKDIGCDEIFITHI